MVLNRTNPLILQKSYSTVGHTVMNGAQCTGGRWWSKATATSHLHGAKKPPCKLIPSSKWQCPSVLSVSLSLSHILGAQCNRNQ